MMPKAEISGYAAAKEWLTQLTEKKSLPLMQNREEKNQGNLNFSFPAHY